MPKGESHGIPRCRSLAETQSTKDTERHGHWRRRRAIIIIPNTNFSVNDKILFGFPHNTETSRLRGDPRKAGKKWKVRQGRGRNWQEVVYGTGCHCGKLEFNPAAWPLETGWNMLQSCSIQGGRGIYLSPLFAVRWYLLPGYEFMAIWACPQDKGRMWCAGKTPQPVPKQVLSRSRWPPMGSVQLAVPVTMFLTVWT